MHTTPHSPSMKLETWIIRGASATATHIFDMMTGNPNNAMVLTLPIAEETKPPKSEPIIIPRTYKVAENVGG